MRLVYGLNVTPSRSYPKIDALDGFDAPIPALNPINDGGVAWSGRTGGVPVDGSHFPKRVRYVHSQRQLPADFESLPEITVSERAKAAIEDVEEGVHQFFPVNFIDSKGKDIERRYWLVVCNRIDSVDRERTTMVLSKTGAWTPARVLALLGDPLPPHIDPGAKPLLVFNLAAIGEVHMWKDKHLSGGGIFVSEAMALRFQAEQLNGLQLQAAQVNGD